MTMTDSQLPILASFVAGRHHLELHQLSSRKEQRKRILLANLPRRHHKRKSAVLGIPHGSTRIIN
jgi:hypothetical protein